MKEIKKHTLTQDQINAIFTFTSKKYVKYYDVQLELVDHVACRIEELMVEDNTLTFEMALQKVYKSYGIFGFTKVAQAKLGELNKMWRKRILSFLYSYISFPKIVLSIVLTFLFYNAFRLMPSFEVDSMLWQWISYGIVIIATLVHGIVQSRKRKLSKYKLTVVDSYNMYSSYVIFWFHIPIQWILLAPESTFFCVLVSVIFAFSFILIYGMLFVFPKDLEKQIIEKYAHLNLKIA